MYLFWRDSLDAEPASPIRVAVLYRRPRPAVRRREAKLPKPLVSGLKSPECVAVAQDGRTYVSGSGEPGKDGDGAVLVLEGDKAVPFADGLDDPKGSSSRATRFTWPTRSGSGASTRTKKRGRPRGRGVPGPPKSLNDLEIDARAVLYVSDSGDLKGWRAIFRIDQKGKVTLVADAPGTRR